MDGKITEAQKRAVILMKEIETSCIEHGLNMTIYDGKIGFVDPEESKIVLLWSPEFKMGGNDV